ncbi:hypothetical protein BRADI_3g10235v3 [Brachypodium distachyon]|uniref:Uncharacterized protein n=1 Tax=Brachypodium distachyon TaxID=15368 RepID=A0A0Q3LPE5_BRADI|nr:hypothetical protein BRADI_3g10235v3 [Brachypodium distachyon]
MKTTDTYDATKLDATKTKVTNDATRLEETKTMYTNDATQLEGTKTKDINDAKTTGTHPQKQPAITAKTQKENTPPTNRNTESSKAKGLAFSKEATNGPHQTYITPQHLALQRAKTRSTSKFKDQDNENQTGLDVPQSQHSRLVIP